ncbi:MAG: class I SAM-dependent methyltransferase [Gammaproteobacteria bacterium]
MDNCPIPLRIVVSDEDSPATDRRVMTAPIHELPMQSQELSAVVLAHTLETEPDPYAVLREVDRVLVDDGYVVIVGFNPASLWGIRRLLPKGEHGASPWGLPVFTSSRVQDWLGLLGFQILRVEYTGAVLPIDSPDTKGRLERVDRLISQFAKRAQGSYVLVARKRRVPLTPVTPPWKKRSSFLPSGLAEPTARDISGPLSNRTLH